jgi:asparagine synthase (glutamine-hydrolysing)
MCGIAGIIDPKGVRPADLRLMSRALRHRGPDGHGFMLYSPERGARTWINQEPPDDAGGGASVGFVHRRLSIVDLSADSLQPMADESGRLCLVYNGELYNYVELRAELEALGHRFKSSGDTEVVLRAYAAWGADCVQRFNGMWAFVLLDAGERRALFSRDRFGIKPLYYAARNGALFFASEIKGLLAAPALTREPNERAVAKFLAAGVNDDTEETFFRGVFQLPAAHSATLRLGDASPAFEPRPYWAIPTARFGGTERQAVERFRELFLDSVRIHLRSDVPVGTCLSGGLDSSSIVCAADLLRKKDAIPNYSHLAFGYCSSDGQYDEKRFMEVAAGAASVQMNYVTFTEEQFESRLQEVVTSQDEPFGSASIIAQWFVFQRARSAGITVMLDGQGADEILAGYHSYFAVIARSLLEGGNILRYLSFKSAYEKNIGAFPFLNSALARRLAPDFLLKPLRLLKRLLRGDPPQLTAAGGGVPGVAPALSRHLVAAGNGRSHAPALDEVLREHVRSSVLPALLRYEDRNSMAHSIEARVPFLDYRLVEHLFSLPWEWKIKGAMTKNILREGMKGILPEAIRTRKDKIGFKSAPDLTFSFARKRYRTLLDNENEFERRWFDPDGVARILDCDEQSVANEFILWRILNTKLWVRHFWR